MKTNFLKSLLIIVILSIPVMSFSEVITIEDIDILVQPLRNNQYQLFIKFDLPELPSNVNIDYAVLSMGMNVISNADSATLVFDILSKDNPASEKIVNYNSNPVTDIIFRRTKGFTEIQLDITQIVDLWVKDGEQNDGIVLVSHRNTEDKSLRSDKIILAKNFKKPTLKIFYTVIE